MDKPDTLNIPAFQRKKMLEQKIKKLQKPPRIPSRVRPNSLNQPEEIFINNTIPISQQLTGSISTQTPQVTLRNFEFAGRIERYFQALKVAIVSVETTIRVGDKLLFEHENGFFEQTIDSIQINRKSVEQADAGSKIGIQTLIKPLSGKKIYKEL